MQKGQSIIRATVTDRSRLVGTILVGSDFREKYKADIVALQRRGNNITERISTTKFAVGDVLFLQVSHDSNLLLQPEANFYGTESEAAGGFSVDIENGLVRAKKEAVWRDLQVVIAPAEGATPKRE